MLQKFQPTHFSHQSKSDLYFQHTSALHIHRAHYCPPQQVNTTCSSTLQLQHKGPYIIRIAYFNTATTKPMANTTNIVTFTHPHTRQMQLPKPSLFLPTISFTLFRFFPPARELLLSKQLQWSRKLEVDNHDPQGTPHIPPRTNTWNISPASK